jgi:hypothetical protein
MDCSVCNFNANWCSVAVSTDSDTWRWPYRAETCCAKWKWKEKIICCITDGLNIHRLFNMACNRMLKYRISLCIVSNPCMLVICEAWFAMCLDRLDNMYLNSLERSRRLWPGWCNWNRGKFVLWKKYYKYKKGLGNAHPAFCSTFL